jgi:hypothetical protein
LAKVISIGRTVHYVAPGSADGRYPPAHRAAIVVENERTPDGDYVPTLLVLNPTGIHFATRVPFDPTGERRYSWHWPEYVPDTEDE